MRVEKEKRKVNIICQDGSIIRGFVHINPGERILDFINDSREDFIAVTDVEYTDKSVAKKENIILNKSAIKLIEEI